ncbi:hypothetical protein LTR56_003421 [Elasticomyces elasticus]|nr:hypothetical protein LTR22_026260 [Elasticomyces elasticus]KAK3655772.1 hypothetical protein LTR56_003421 [Elasticomyces elasticus]KAK4931375.1 hypothetical protein LTR49_002076 [Elasticomyces elasticus]KAK5766106.1 hypothetical protein LTS12_003852 [Elasticomyces elasticus]
MAPADKLIVVLGATGIQGGSVARLYATLPGWRIRGITRDPTKASCAPLHEAGVELVAADLDDVASLDRAFEGANAIFAVTEQGRKPNEIAMDLEIQQGKNIIHAAAKHLHTLDRLIVSTLSDSEKWSGGQIKWNLHFDGKAKYTQYLKDKFPDLAKKTSYVQMGSYLSNWRAFPFLAPAKQADGSFVHVSSGSPNAKLTPYVDPPNDTGYFVKALVEHQDAGLTMLGFCELISTAEYVAIWSKTLGVKARTEPLNMEVLKSAGLPEFLLQELGETSAYSSTWGWDGGDPEVKHPKELGVEIKKLTKVAEWVKKEDWSAIL